MEPFAIGFLNVFARVSVSPNSGGLPGTNQAEKVISGLMFSGLLACVAGVIIGGAVWAVSSHGGNHHNAQRGKASFLISAVAAAVIAAAPAVVNFFEGLRSGVH
jgi:Family of unknown function (DUF6112)/Type IV secretion system pilin